MGHGRTLTQQLHGGSGPRSPAIRFRPSPNTNPVRTVGPERIMAEGALAISL
jgi:hypothetical protein